MKELIEKIENWGIDKGINYCNPLMQTTKTLEECIELQQAIINYESGIFSKNYDMVGIKAHPYDYFVEQQEKHLNEIKDAIGDVFVTLVILSLQDEEMELAIYNKIERYNPINMSIDLVKAVTDLQLSFNDKYCLFCHNKHALINGIVGFLVSFAEGYDFMLKECIEHAYNEIKDRKGQIVNGLFVKEEN